jgi:hypothetical protein
MVNGGQLQERVSVQPLYMHPGWESCIEALKPSISSALQTPLQWSPSVETEPFEKLQISCHTICHALLGPLFWI